MIERLRAWVAPAYLFLCLLLGGSAQGVWGNAVLRLLALGIIVWALLGYGSQSRPAKQLLALVGLATLLVVVQLIPLPMSIWADLPGREQFVEGLRLLGQEPGALPLSLAPYDSLTTLLALLPPLGMFAAMIGIRGNSAIWVAAALVGGTVAGVLLGILQVSSGDPAESSLYFYRHSNFGVATGFFANANHMASLLLAAVPFIAALGATIQERSKDARFRTPAMVLVAGGMLLLVLGLILNRSMAGYGLGVPVLLASLLMLFGSRIKVARSALIGVGLVSIVAVATLWASPVTQDAASSVSTRQSIFLNSFDLVGQYAPVGSGLGTFEQVYRLTERPETVEPVHVNHAHNDYLEVAVELGIPGILLILLFMLWWGAAVVRMLRSPASDQFAMAGAIASGAILLHSVVDYPLRTAAIGAVFAACLALILQSRKTARSDKDLRPARHIKVG